MVQGVAVSAETVGGANRVLKERYFEGKSGVTEGGGQLQERGSGAAVRDFFWSREGDAFPLGGGCRDLFREKELLFGYFWG